MQIEFQKWQHRYSDHYERNTITTTQLWNNIFLITPSNDCHPQTVWTVTIPLPGNLDNNWFEIGFRPWKINWKSGWWRGREPWEMEGEVYPESLDRRTSGPTCRRVRKVRRVDDMSIFCHTNRCGLLTLSCCRLMEASQDSWIGLLYLYSSWEDTRYEKIISGISDVIRYKAWYLICIKTLYI